MTSDQLQSSRSGQPADLQAGGIIPTVNEGACLDSGQLRQLEQSFRQWAEASRRRDVQFSRLRVLLIFLLIRYTGAKLNEILELDPFVDINGQQVCIRHRSDEHDTCARSIALPEAVAREIEQALNDADFRATLANHFAVDPAFIRKKFYERAEDCGFDKRLAGPEMIRRARAVELMQSNMPLPAVQQLLGHASPNLTTAHVTYSAEELQRVTRIFLERESSRSSSARNTFYGKIATIKRGDIQAQVSLVTPAGQRITTLITLESLDRLSLQVGRLVTAEIKAPWVMVQPGDSLVNCSAENRFLGTVIRIRQGKVVSEFVVRLEGGGEICALVSAEGRRTLVCQEGDVAWVFFNCFAVILHD
ncbi:TOBE domain-containing protein [uncultured Vibrio sp.]|uniref:TOBE domain-containing protein n=1 Tax=uncultured Vibrio sp. TaxID=114054 RepID=UPI002AA91DE4|nr:TOBE domain-containing protein [uncultured Vibrio sp.]